MEAKIGEAVVKVAKGDICDCATEAIVNAANNRLLMGGGVAGAIKRRGGEEIEREAVTKGPIPIGEAAVSGAGRLAAKYVIHAAGMGMDFKTDTEKIRAATRNSLLRAEELEITSIAFPSIGTGVGGFPKEEAAAIMVEVVVKHLRGKSGLKEVVFCLFDEASRQAFGEALRRQTK